MVDLQTQLEEERQAHRAEKETLKKQISKLGTKVDMLMQKSEDQLKTFEEQITKLTTLMQDVHSKLESHVLEREDHDDQSVGVGGDRLQDVHPVCVCVCVHVFIRACICVCVCVASISLTKDIAIHCRLLPLQIMNAHQLMTRGPLFTAYR